MADLTQTLLDFVKSHQNWAVAVMFLGAFGESFALVGLLFPGTALLIAAGALLRSGSLPFLPVMTGAILGAVLGDWVSYWLGRRFGTGVARLWPFRRNPALLPSGIAFFKRHGGKSVFIGRFLGPVRAIIPLAAGVMRMSRPRFWVANIASALVWAPLLLLVGDVVGEAGRRLVGGTDTTILMVGILGLFGIGGAVLAGLHWCRSKS